MDECGAWDERCWWRVSEIVYVIGSGQRGWRGGEWMTGLGLEYTNPGTGGEWVGGLDQGLEGWCYVCREV